MDKITYLAQLAEGLARWVPERERQEILRYYAEYFQEAGEGREAEVIQELGDPWALSSRLAVEGGYVTQQGANSWTPRQRSRKVWPVVTVAVVAIVAVVAVGAAQFGRIVGQIVSSAANEASYVAAGTEDLVMQEPDIDWGLTPVPSEAPVAFIEGTCGFWSMEDGTLEEFDAIDMDVSIANVTVDVGEDYTLYISSNSTLGNYGLKWEIKNGVLKIRDRDSVGLVQIDGWNDLKNAVGINADPMDVAITVPEGAELDELKIKAGLGDMILANLEAYSLEAETGLGDVECSGVCAYDEVELESGMGDVTLGIQEAYSGVEYNAKTGMGNVEVQVNGCEKDWDYEAKTGMGTVTVNRESLSSGKVERKSTGDYKLELESGMGDVKLYFQDDRW